MAYSRGDVRRRIDFETWELDHTIPDEDGIWQTVINLTGKHTETQALKLCQTALPAGYEAKGVRLVKRWSEPRKMTLAKFAALSEPAEPEVTISPEEVKR